tara:strand:+ start:2242 stop:3138 length:897 start_codon:yes stop_codon:yes gene_type:complete
MITVRYNLTIMSPKITKKITHIFFLMRLDKPIGILLLMWPMLWSLWLANNGNVSMKIFAVFMLGVVIMRSAGCVLNDFADRKIDPYVKRTKERPIASGKVTEKEALVLFFVLIFLAFLLILFLNRQTQVLAIIGACITAIYPFVKRILSAPQLILGFAFGWGVPMAFAAQTGTVPLLGWLIFSIAIFWALIYDTFYAMVDRDDDINLNVKSTAILFGEKDLLFIGIFQLLMILQLFLMAKIANLGLWVYLSIVASIFLMLYHQWISKDKDRESCFHAFKHNHYIGMIIFIGIFLNYKT